MPRALNPPKAKQLLPRQPGGSTYGGHPELFGTEPWIWNPGFAPSHDLCSCPLFHRSMCRPGFRTLMFTAGPRIRKTSCSGYSERKSTWLLPEALCPPSRWYPCDDSHLQLSASLFSQHSSSRAGWWHSGPGTPLLQSSLSPESELSLLGFQCFSEWALQVPAANAYDHKIPRHFSYFYELARCSVSIDQSESCSNNKMIILCKNVFISVEVGIFIYTETGSSGTSTKLLRYSSR